MQSIYKINLGARIPSAISSNITHFREFASLELKKIKRYFAIEKSYRTIGDWD